MKNFTLSVATVLALSAFAVAGGDIEPVAEPMVVEEVASDSGFYIGGAFSLANTSTDYHENYGDIGGPDYVYNGSWERDSNAYMLQAGYQFNQYIAIEGRYWGSMDSNEWSSSSYTDGNLNYSNSSSDGDWDAWGIYAKPMYPVTNSVDVYALLGYGNVSIDDKWSGDVSMLDEDVFQWGIGASVDITENLSAFADYVQLVSDEGGSYVPTDSGWDYNTDTWETSIYTINIGLSYKF
jgi:opacity protein-like surface antigen